MLVKKFVGVCFAVFVLGLVNVAYTAAYSGKIPDTTINNSDMKPVNYGQNLTAGLTLMHFQNLQLRIQSRNTLELHLNVGNDVAFVDFGLDLNQEGGLKLEIDITVEPKAGIDTIKGIGIYITIEPNATEDINASVRMSVDEIRKKIGEDVNAKKLMWAYFNETENKWIYVTSEVVDGYLVADTDHFSTWTVVDLSESKDYTIYIVAAVLIGALLAVAAIKTKK